MRKIQGALRLKAEGLTERQIARSLGVARSTVGECLRRKGPTLFLLHQKHKENFPDGYQYSRFCERYREWAGKIDLVMRQEHRAGEKVFVDYSGQLLPITDGRTGEIREAEVFVGVLGASCYTYAEATWTQSLPDWLGSHVRMLEFFGASPRVCVGDNLKSGVTRPHRYEPQINASYQDLLDHYGIASIPAHVRKPRQKSRVEGGVLLAQRWILARLRNTPLFSLEQANRAIKKWTCATPLPRSSACAARTSFSGSRLR